MNDFWHGVIEKQFENLKELKSWVENLRKKYNLITNTLIVVKDIDEEERAFNFKDVKLAVQWLLRELEKEQERIERLKGYDAGKFDGLEIAKILTKKAFKDVVEDEEKRNER